MTISEKSVIEFLKLRTGILNHFPFFSLIEVHELHDHSFQTNYSL